MRRAQRPVILLAFADPRRDLGNLKEESNGIADLFYRRDDQVEVVILDHPPLERIIQTFQRHRDRVAILHYGGHANGFELLLETVAGETQQAGASGLAQFLSRQRGLHLVFLNGCSTKNQVDNLLDAGVKCVIATDRAIDDAVATYFSRQFYASLTSGADLATAFEEASGAAQASRGDNTRALYLGGRDDLENDRENEPNDALPWRLYQSDDKAPAWSFEDEVRRRRRAVVAGDSRQTASVRQLQVLLERVSDLWVEGFLGRLDDGGAPLAVNRELRHKAVDDPWEAVIESADREPEVVPPGTSIVDLFDDANQSLLILGQPGSGKTTTLVELTRELVSRAAREPDQPVPAVFHLSSWDDQAANLRDFLQSELSGKYKVPAAMAAQWLAELRLILLLDGLDEVGDLERARCVEAIHGFQKDVGAAGVVVTCRVEEYEALPEQLSLESAISLQPLTDQQIFDFVSDGDKLASPLARLLEQFAPLRDLASSPLMLGIMKDAFIDVEAIDDEQLNSLEDCQAHLFDRYIDRMFRQRQKLTRINSREQATSWLEGIAERMSRRGNAILMIEDIQPEWLDGRSAKIAASIATCTALGLFTGLIVTLFWLTAAEVSSIAKPLVDAGLARWIVPMFLVWFLAVAWLEQAFPILSMRRANATRNNARGFGKLAILFGVWSLLTLIAVAVQKAAPLDSATDFSALAFVSALLMCGSMATLIVGAFGFNQTAMHSIHSVDLLGFSPKEAVTGAFLGGLAGVYLSLPYVFFWPDGGDAVKFLWVDRVADARTTEVVVVVALVLLGIDAGAITRGLRPRMSETKTRANEGMRLSLRNGLIWGTVAGVTALLTLLLLTLLCTTEQAPHSYLLENGYRTVLFSLGSAAVVFYGCFFWFGGFDVLKHYVLRLVLAAYGQLPLRLISFLEDATRLKLLQRVGGGYMFLHRSLAEHFARGGEIIAPMTDPTPEQKMWFLKHHAWNCFDQGLDAAAVANQLLQQGFPEQVVTVLVQGIPAARQACVHTEAQRQQIVQSVWAAINQHHYQPIVEAMDPACDDDRTIYKVFDALGEWINQGGQIAVWSAFGLSKMVGFGDCALIHALGSEDEATRYAAAFGLGKMGGEAENAITALEAATRDPSELVRTASIEALQRIRSEL